MDNTQSDDGVLGDSGCLRIESLNETLGDQVDKDTVSPWTSKGNVDMVSTFLRGKSGTGLGGDNVSEAGSRSIECTVFSGKVENLQGCFWLG